MAEILSTLSNISFIVAGVCLVLAVFFWFFFKIPAVIGDLTGRTARKSIAKMRVTNEKTGVKKYEDSKINIQRGKPTSTMSGINEPNKKNAVVSERPETGLLDDNKAKHIVTAETAILDSDATGLLNDDEATTLLNSPELQKIKRTGGKKLTIIDEVMLIHTNEVIK